MEGNFTSHHLLAYWYFAGIGVQPNCQKSFYHYEVVADRNFKLFLEGKEFVGGRRLDKEHLRYSLNEVNRRLDWIKMDCMAKEVYQ